MTRLKNMIEARVMWLYMAFAVMTGCVIVSFAIPTTLPGIIAVSIVTIVASAYIMQVWIHHKCFNYSKQLAEVIYLGDFILSLAPFAILAQRDAYVNVSGLVVFVAILVTYIVTCKVLGRCFFKKFSQEWSESYESQQIEDKKSELRSLFDKYGHPADAPGFERERKLVEDSINLNCQGELDKAISYFKSKSECFGLKPKA